VGAGFLAQGGGQFGAGSDEVAGGLAGLGVEQVRSRHVGEDLSPDQISGRQFQRFLRVQLQCSELAIV
jgi:hypothetical protein